MKKSLLTVALVAIGACASGANAHADAIPYPSAGSVNPVTSLSQPTSPASSSAIFIVC